jgi:hypothetical protein
MEFLMHFVESNRDSIDGLSTREVVEKVIKPTTAGGKCSYLEWIIRRR